MKLMENEDVELFSHFDVVFKTILTDNAMKLMENEDVEPFSHFDVVSKRPISISPILNVKIWP